MRALALRIPRDLHERAKAFGMDAEELWYRNRTPDPQHDRKRQETLKAPPLANLGDALESP